MWLNICCQFIWCGFQHLHFSSIGTSFNTDMNVKLLDCCICTCLGEYLVKCHDMCNSSASLCKGSLFISFVSHVTLNALFFHTLKSPSNLWFLILPSGEVTPIDGWSMLYSGFMQCTSGAWHIWCKLPVFLQQDLVFCWLILNKCYIFAIKMSTP